VIHAPLQSPSVVGAYTFTAQPGDETVMDVDATLFAAGGQLFGIGPLTSMFLFDESSPARFDDYRRAVHDSDGLQILSGNGERVWRQLANPKTLQVSAFTDQSPRGFGLLQRKRRFDAYEDFEARYELRPSLWVEPRGDWGQGHIELIEIPTEREIHDNIVAFWRPPRREAGRGRQFRIDCAGPRGRRRPPPASSRRAPARRAASSARSSSICDADPGRREIHLTSSTGRVLEPRGGRSRPRTRTA
jgi:glucans biosynthesis protein